MTCNDLSARLPLEFQMLYKFSMLLWAKKDDYRVCALITLITGWSMTSVLNSYQIL